MFSEKRNDINVVDSEEIIIFLNEVNHYVH